MRQQDMLSDQSANNASLQFNAANQQQVNTFMSGLKSQVETNNATRADAVSQYNSQLAQQRAALDAGNDLQSQQIAAQINGQIDQFNSQLAFNRDQFNATNSNVVNQSNAQWRRQTNTANTAGQNSINQANAINAFNLSSQSLANLWQETRDSANWNFQSSQSDLDYQGRLAIAALGNEATKDAANQSSIVDISKLAYNVWNEIRK
jgi:paraquat-inducible protein B